MFFWSTFGFVFFAIILILLLWFIIGYNGFIRLKTLIDEAWSGIDVQLKRRYDLVPNLIAVVKQYSIHEKSVIENIVQMRAAAMGAGGVAEKAKAEAGLNETLKTLFAIAENYPELKANENFLSLQKELATIENEIQLSRRYYNGTARNYNMKIATLPSNIIALIARFKSVPYFQLSSPKEREIQRVEF